MKIGFFGSQGTGKTTTMNAFKSNPSFRHYSTITSRAREASKSGLPLNTDATPLSQLLVTVSRCNEDINAGHCNVISDRTPLDSLAYTLYSVENKWSDYYEQFYIDTSWNLVSACMSKYDALFYFPVYWSPKSDGVRSSDKTYQEDIDKIIRRAATSMGITSFTMPNDSVEKRVEFIRSQINV